MIRSPQMGNSGSFQVCLNSSQQCHGQCGVPRAIALENQGNLEPSKAKLQPRKYKTQQAGVVGAQPLPASTCCPFLGPKQFFSCWSIVRPLCCDFWLSQGLGLDLPHWFLLYQYLPRKETLSSSLLNLTLLDPLWRVRCPLLCWLY